MSRDRRRAERQGRWAERLAVWRLRLGGWRIVAQRWRHAVGEIDIVARRGRVLAFIEVKRRPDGRQAAEAVTAKQRQRIARAAEAFIASRPDLRDCEARFDLIAVAPLRPPRRIADAWRP